MGIYKWTIGLNSSGTAFKKANDLGSEDWLGDVSGATRATPSAEAARWAPDLIIKFSSVQVSPESQ